MKIAIDGTAASGKGTLAKGLAKKLGYDYLDTGLLYRRLALDIYKKGLTKFNLINERGIISDTNINMLADITLNLTLPLSDHPDLRKQEISHLSAVIASIPEIREILFKKQRMFANNPPSKAGVILDGRDIGSIILPEAKIKFFIDAKPEIRAKRRYAELKSLSAEVQEETILDDLIKRDKADRTRHVAPLKRVPDAFFIDSSALNADEVLQIALNYING
ncbi:(d)CMP kinase [Alphaproteobacteria bacterium]|nr:(d)CMP kinase [Alphaproteobacteria bacterium]